MFEFDKFWDGLIAVILAASGGMARLLHNKDGQPILGGRIFSELFISGFSGIMVYMLFSYFGFNGGLIGVAAGSSGWLGPKILDMIAERTVEVVSTKKLKGDD